MADKILVTGGAGFVGSHVTDMFLSKGYEVVVLDNLLTGHKENVSQGAHLFEIDLRDPRVDRIFKDEKPKFVCHHAAQANVQKSVRDPLIDADANIMGSLHVLEQCRKNDVEKVIFISSGGAIYGEPQVLPCDENHPIKPLSPYGSAKASVELYLPIYHSIFGLRYTILRYANVYGPRQDPFGEAGVVSIFARQMINKQRCTINGTGSQERDFVYVEDVARANLLSVEGGGDSETYNIGSGEGVSIKEIFSKIDKLTENNLQPFYGAPKSGEVFKIYLNVAKARKYLKWEPKISLGQGLAQTVASLNSDFTSVP